MPEPTSLVDVQQVRANGTVLHTETRGRGPAVLLIAGAGGDAAELAGVAATLADQFTVTTYDRRGNSRSPRPAGWVQTSLAEQADDAAALLATLGQRPAVVVGTSAGGSIALEVALRHPDAVRAAIVHEPPILAGTTNPQAVTADLGAMIQQGMAAGGPRAAMELFLRWAAGDAAFASLDPADRDRYLGNGEVFCGVELPPFMAYAPAVEAIGDARGPIVAAGSHASRDPASPHHFLTRRRHGWPARPAPTWSRSPAPTWPTSPNPRRWPSACARCCETSAELRTRRGINRPSRGHGRRSRPPTRANHKPGRRSETRS